MSNDTQMFRVYINATPEAIWEAIVSPEWNARFGYRSASEYELHAGGSYKALATAEMRTFGMPEVVVDGEILEADPPKKLVHTFHAYFSPEMIEEPGALVTYTLEPENNGMTRLTVVNEVNNSPVTFAILAGGDGKLTDGGGGYPFILSDLKSLLETGKGLQD